MRASWVAPLLLLLLTAGEARPAVPEEVRVRRRAIEVKYAKLYMEIAKEARKVRDEDLVREVFTRAEELDPGNDAVLKFGEPNGNGKARPDTRRSELLKKRFASVRADEAKARLELARWCDDEAWAEESVEEAREALRLCPGPVCFDEEGVLTESTLGRLPRSLSISVLDGHEVFRGRLVPRSEVPSPLAWADGFSLRTEHFLIKTNVSGSLCRTMGRTLEAARVVYREETGFDVRAPITVFVVSTRSAYEEYHVKLGKEKPDRDNIGKCWRDFCVVDGSRSTEAVLSVAVHEVAHGYLNLGIEALTGKEGAGVPTWLTEGLATFCAGYGQGSNAVDNGVVDPEKARAPSLRRFQELIRVRETRPLAAFLPMDCCDSIFYYQAFAFWWFLRDGASEEIRAHWRRAYDRICRAGLTEGATPLGNRIFVEEMGDLAGLDAAFYEWVTALPLSD
ncbi:MAG: hypothetical protein MUE73_14535 [Planctomycetes bacterium]|jgi:hypothetical protein|nr:hypothetical protein [Planctomycetota bacterium]